MSEDYCTSCNKWLLETNGVCDCHIGKKVYMVEKQVETNIVETTPITTNPTTTATSNRKLCDTCNSKLPISNARHCCKCKKNYKVGSAGSGWHCDACGTCKKNRFKHCEQCKKCVSKSTSHCTKCNSCHIGTICPTKKETKKESASDCNCIFSTYQKSTYKHCYECNKCVYIGNGGKPNHCKKCNKCFEVGKYHCKDCDTHHYIHYKYCSKCKNCFINDHCKHCGSHHNHYSRTYCKECNKCVYSYRRMSHCKKCNKCTNKNEYHCDTCKTCHGKTKCLCSECGKCHTITQIYCATKKKCVPSKIIDKQLKCCSEC